MLFSDYILDRSSKVSPCRSGKSGRNEKASQTHSVGLLHIVVMVGHIRSDSLPALAGSCPPGDGLGQSFQQPFEMRHAFTVLAPFRRASR